MSATAKDFPVRTVTVDSVHLVRVDDLEAYLAQVQITAYWLTGEQVVRAIVEKVNELKSHVADPVPATA
jgi:hypothetical protein